MFCPLAERTAGFFSGKLLSAQDVSLLVSFPPRAAPVSCPACFSWHYCFPCPKRSSVYKVLAPFDPRTSFRPSPGASYCFAPQFPLYKIDFRSFHAVVPGLFQTARFCSAERLPLFSHPHSFVSWDVSLCLPCVSCAISFHSSARNLLFYRLLPFVVDLLQVIRCQWSSMSAFCLANVFHCISMPRFWFAYVVPLFLPLKMAFWSSKCRLAGPQRVGFSVIQSWKVILRGSRSPQLQWSCRETAKNTKKWAVNTMAERATTAFCRGILQRILQVRGLWTRSPVIFIHRRLSWAVSPC